jgi:hypothetical protein
MKLNREQMMEVRSNANRLADHALLDYWDNSNENSYHQITVIQMLRDLRHLIDVVEMEENCKEKV